jgi:TDG/mug DNA glycosylase family protein
VNREAAHAPVVPDLLAKGLRLVFCGTAPSRVSKERRAYYANPGNRFWKTLHEVGLTPRRFAPPEYPMLLKLGIGLTDLNKREWGNDDELTPAGFDLAGFETKIVKYAPHAVAFTSKTAASIFLGQSTGAIAYGRQKTTIGRTVLFALPSTSGQAVRYFDIAPWQAVVAFARRGQ